MNPILKYFGLKAYLRSLKKQFYLEVFNKGIGCLEHGKWFYDDENAVQHFKQHHDMPRPTAQRKIKNMKENRK